MTRRFVSIHKQKKAPTTLEGFIMEQEAARRLAERDYAQISEFDLWRNELWLRK